MHKLGLIGFPLSHSFSKQHFDHKFKQENIKNFTYSLYEIRNLKYLENIILKENIIGLNVTRPYKKDVIKYLDKLDDLSLQTQSVNTIFIDPNTKKKTGFNTDAIGFEKLFLNCNYTKNIKGLILGSGGAAQTVSYVLKKMQIKHTIVSRNPRKNMINYTELESYMKNAKLIINTTPLGQYPYIDTFPNIPYNLMSKKHICIDLIYNPIKSLFLQKSYNQGAQVFNGKKMLITQAEKSWYIWKKMIQ